MRIARRAVFVAVLLALLPTAAGAVSFVQVTDPNDVPGKLDLELVKGVRTASGQPITFTVRVQAPFAKTVLGPAANWVKVFLNVDGDANVDFVGTIKKTGRTLSVVFRGQGDNFEALPVQRPNRRTMRFTVPGGAARAERSGLDDRPVALRERHVVRQGLPGRGSEQLRLDRTLS
jgi:hypothetical protein